MQRAEQQRLKVFQLNYWNRIIQKQYVLVYHFKIVVNIWINDQLYIYIQREIERAKLYSYITSIQVLKTYIFEKLNNTYLKKTIQFCWTGLMLYQMLIDFVSSAPQEPQITVCSEYFSIKRFQFYAALDIWLSGLEQLVILCDKIVFRIEISQY